MPEKFSRSAKSLVQAGKKRIVDFSLLPLGYQLEIIPLQNPYDMKVSDSLSFQVILDNQPLKNSLITAFTKENPTLKQKVRTDEQGQATITLHSAGKWMIKTIHMQASTDADYDWESIWATLTFALLP